MAITRTSSSFLYTILLIGLILAVVVKATDEPNKNAAPDTWPFWYCLYLRDRCIADPMMCPYYHSQCPFSTTVTGTGV
ncbi:transmembrane protein, putative [Medicago truncatula]|uniref:Transmembrane protein, putative n=1 Tax=Medicago truncatula TaxID=3880 RepID=G7K9R7_MEDTR|nr:transmembrane protein, putative [Medicago truncatula]